MRKATVRLAVIAASALILPTQSLPTIRETVAVPSRPRPAVVAAERPIRQVSRAVPPVAPALARSIEHLRTSQRAASARAATPLTPYGDRAPAPTVRRAAVHQRTATASPPRARPNADAASPISRFYVVGSGDTLWVIARRYEVSVERLAAANGLRPTSVLSLGKKLSIPAMGGPEVASEGPGTTRRAPAASTGGAALQHSVRDGESTWVIARRYKISVDDLIDANDLSEDGRIRPGQRLTIPGRQAPTGGDIARRRPPSNADDAPASRIETDEPRTSRRVGFTWPSRGILTSRFGMRYRRHHNGIDIASATGTAIHAARDGVVTFAGRRGGYGLVVYIDHGDNYTTVYGHASRVHVTVGERVRRGDLIARVGCTGSCTGSHLHFEVHEGVRPVNPLRHLR